MEITKYLEWFFYMLRIKMCVVNLKYIYSKFVNLSACLKNKTKWKWILKYAPSIQLKKTKKEWFTLFFFTKESRRKEIIKVRGQLINAKLRNNGVD